jgi:hypothetical protein
VLNKGNKDMFVKIDWDNEDIGDLEELLIVDESSKDEALSDMEDEFEVVLEEV